MDASRIAGLMRRKTSVPIYLLCLTCLLSGSVRSVTAAESATSCPEVFESGAGLDPDSYPDSARGVTANTPADGNTGCAGRSGSTPDVAGYPSLNLDREADDVQDDEPPQPAAGFGRYRGHDRIIYWSEQR